jgi:hypothetical protein
MGKRENRGSFSQVQNATVEPASLVQSRDFLVSRSYVLLSLISALRIFLEGDEGMADHRPRRLKTRLRISLELANHLADLWMESFHRSCACAYATTSTSSHSHRIHTN